VAANISDGRPVACLPITATGEGGQTYIATTQAEGPSMATVSPRGPLHLLIVDFDTLRELDFTCPVTNINDACQGSVQDDVATREDAHHNISERAACRVDQKFLAATNELFPHP